MQGSIRVGFFPCVRPLAKRRDEMGVGEKDLRRMHGDERMFEPRHRVEGHRRQMGDVRRFDT